MWNKLTRSEKKYLLTLTIIPYAIILLILAPLSSGIYGTVYSDTGSSNNFYGGDYTGYGHFEEGDAYINGSTGWVICQGNIRYSGNIKIKDADLHFVIEDNEEGLALFSDTYKEIKLYGDGGEMEGGIPIYIFSLIGSLIGFTLWLSWYFAKKNKSNLVTISSLGLIFLTITFSILFWCYICIGAIIILLPIFLLIYSQYRKYKRNFNSFFPVFCLYFSILIFIISLLTFIIPVHLFNYHYNEIISISSMTAGYLGMISAVILIGFSFGAKQLRKELEHQPPPPPSPFYYYIPKH